MFKHLHVIVLLVVMSFISVSLVMAQERPVDLHDGQTEYLEKIELDLKVEPGETASKRIHVPVKVTESDGTIYYDYEVVTFILSNSLPDLTYRSRTAAMPTASKTTVQCSGVLNAGSRAYTSFVLWSYNGSSVWHEENGHLNHSASSPWQTNGVYNHINYPWGPASSIATYNIGYFINSSTGQQAAHRVIWILENDGTCAATGNISLY